MALFDANDGYTLYEDEAPDLYELTEDDLGVDYTTFINFIESCDDAVRETLVEQFGSSAS